ncbi:MAG: hypothetical protein RIR26_2092 [Pseudomonadota bacterium]
MNLRPRDVAKTSSIQVLFIAACAGAAPYAYGEGSASDLDGLSSIGWPVGVPMSCVALNDTLAKSLNDAVDAIRRQCFEQNQKMKADGFAACAQDECLDTFQVNAQGHDWGALKLKLGRSEWTGQAYVTLSYSYPGTSAPLPSSRLVCFDPQLKAEELLQGELSRWDFQRFVEFCVKPKLK